MGLQEMYDEIRAGYWQHPDPKQCGCGGRGWMVSDLDTTHWCPIHGKGVPPAPDWTWDDAFRQEYEKNPFLYEGAKVARFLSHLIRQAQDGKVVIDVKELEEETAGLQMALCEYEQKADQAWMSEVVKMHVESETPPDDDMLVDAWKQGMVEKITKAHQDGRLTRYSVKAGDFLRVVEPHNEYPQDVHFHFPVGTVVRVTGWAEEGHPIITDSHGYGKRRKAPPRQGCPYA